MPSFYRWLVEKYPAIVAPAPPAIDDDQELEDAAAGVWHDNLYLDMNGIIHPCFHPEDPSSSSPAPATFDDVFRAIFAYTDHLLRIARPRKLLYLALGTFINVS